MAKTKQKEKGSEFYENPEVLAEQLSKTEQFIENNKKIVFGLGGLIALVIVAFFGYRYYINNLNQEAQIEMYQAIYWFEDAQYDLALDGDGNNFGFYTITEDYSGTKAANLANYYIGASLLQQGNFKESVEYLKDFSSDDLLIQARAYALTGDAYMELGNYTNAADYYGKAAEYKSNEQFSPIYLYKQGLAWQAANNKEAAMDSYKQIVNKYKSSAQYAEAQKYLSLLQAEN